MEIRLIRWEDAAAYRDLCLQLDRETPFRLYEPGERSDSLADFQAELARFLQNPQSAILVAEDPESGELVGYLQAIGRTQRRVRHVVSINVAVLRSQTGRGIGSKLFAALEAWAMEHGIHRLDLTVMETNPGARRLYSRLGFQEEGVKRRSMRVDGQWIDEIYMAKWLEYPRESGKMEESE